MADPDTATGTPERILLVRLSALGDVVQSLPALAALRAARPTAEIAWLVEDRNAAVLVGHPDIDRLFVFRRGRIRSGEQSALGVGAELRRELRRWGPDIAIDLQGNLKSAVLTRLSGARRRIGLPPGEAREKAHWFATERVARGAEREHRADRALRLVAPLGAPPTAEGRLPPVADEDRAAVDAGLEGLGLPRAGFAVLVPGTSDFGAFKRWPAARFGDLAQHLAGNGLPVLVAYGPGQRELADAVVAAADGAARLAPETATLPQLIDLLSRSRLVVGADSGPVLLASFAGAPTVALFGPKDPAIYAPRGPRTRTVRKGVYCSPCPLRKCGDPICMTTLWTGEVANAADDLLRETA